MVSNRAFVIKLGGNAEMSGAMAMVAALPELKALKAENEEYRRKLEAEQARRWQKNGKKLAAYRANIQTASWWQWFKVYSWALLCKVCGR